MLRVAICSGGTGGHMFPACALLESIKNHGHEVRMITDTRGNTYCDNIENKTVVNTIRLSYKKPHEIIFGFSRLFLKFVNLWKDKHPDVIIGFGGLFTVVPIIVAKMFGAKVVVYEQNSIVGKANKLLSVISDLKISTFKIDDEWSQIASPVRKEFLEIPNCEYKCDDKIKILVIGGSQGALSFSCILPKALSFIGEDQRKNIEIIQQVSSGKADELQLQYQKLGVKSKLMNFVHNIAEEMSNVQLVICRSGASTLAELSAIGRPAILIPYPIASENHQFYNAIYYKNKNAAWVVEENENIEKELSSIIVNILENRELLKVASSNMINKFIGGSTEKFVDLIEKLCI